MANGDRVMVKSSVLSTYAVDGLRMGTIIAESLPLCDVAWDDGKVTTGIVRNAALWFVGEAELDPEHPEPGQHVGRFSQVAFYPSNDNDGADSDGPKSPAAAGVVHAAFFVSNEFSEDEQDFTARLYMSWFDGRVKALLPAAITGQPSTLDDSLLVVDQPGRRLVGKG